MRRSLSEILNDKRPTSVIGQLVSKSKHISSISSLFDHSLPRNLKGNVKLASYENGLATVIVPNAVYATQLRLEQYAILERLRQHSQFQYAYRIVAKVRPSHSTMKTNKKRFSKPISSATTTLLQEEAKHCDDPDIAAVLASLAKHGQ